MKKCYVCDGKVVNHAAVKRGVTLKGERCTKCGEEFFPSGELLKFEALTAKRKNYRTFGRLGSSTIIRFPDDVLKQFKVEPGDLGIFETTKDGILIRPVKE